MYSRPQGFVVYLIRFETKTSWVMRSNPAQQLFFMFQLENILRSI